MTLAEYIKKYHIHPVMFSLKMEISVSSLYSYMRGKSPHLTTAKRIEKATKGEVTVEELMKNYRRADI